MPQTPSPAGQFVEDCLPNSWHRFLWQRSTRRIFRLLCRCEIESSKRAAPVAVAAAQAEHSMATPLPRWDSVRRRSVASMRLLRRQWQHRSRANHSSQSVRRNHRSHQSFPMKRHGASRVPSDDDSQPSPDDVSESADGLIDWIVVVVHLLSD